MDRPGAKEVFKNHNLNRLPNHESAKKTDTREETTRVDQSTEITVN